MSSLSYSIPQVQLQEQPCDCSHHFSTAGASQASSQAFASWRDGGQAVQRQGSSPIKVQTKGRFTIIEEEGSSPKLSFRLPSFGGSLSGQKSAAGAGSAHAAPADNEAASTSGTIKTARMGSNSGRYTPPSSSKKPAAGALPMPGQAL